MARVAAKLRTVEAKRQKRAKKISLFGVDGNRKKVMVKNVVKKSSLLSSGSKRILKSWMVER